MNTLTFDFPLALKAGLPLVGLVAVLYLIAQWRRGLSWKRLLLSIGLRIPALLLLVFLAARPSWKEPLDRERTSVYLLVDRSASMSIEDGGTVRYKRVLNFARESLLPALKRAGLHPNAFLFADDVEPADGKHLAEAQPAGRSTDLASAVVRSVGGSDDLPLAIVALTDGAVNVTHNNPRAVSAMLEGRVPFVGIGFGSEMGVRTLALQRAISPPTVPPKQEFQISAQLEMSSDEEMPPFDLLLLRNGLLHEKKTVRAGKGQRFWLESFSIEEEQVGDYTYTLQMQPPAVQGLRCPNALAETKVRVLRGGELRVLFAQGALSWDYKFIRLALEGDPSIQLTGLTRTAKNTFFHQDVATAEELSGGFPKTMDELAPFRVVVLSNFSPLDLSPEQQELVKRYCAEYGGGVLMIGGPGTFDSSWQGTTLEQLLPVRFAANRYPPGMVPSPTGLPEGAFRLAITPAAANHSVFRIADGGSVEAAWGRVPIFRSCANVERPKRGAQVWATYSRADRPNDSPHVLIAQQRYGAGLSAVVCTDNFWIWRLAKEGNPEQYDRFWRQFLHHLSETGGTDITIQFPDQNMRPGEDIRAIVERRPDPEAPDEPMPYSVRISDPDETVVKEQTLQIAPSGSRELTFQVQSPGVHTISVQDSSQALQASRTFEVKDTSVEYLHPSRDMDSLRQWASLTGGVAIKAEDCEDSDELLARIKEQTEKARLRRQDRTPAFVKPWVLALLLAFICTEWALRKLWRLP